MHKCGFIYYNAVFELSTDAGSTEKFEWEQAVAGKEVTPKYEIIFFKENETIANALFSVQSIINNLTINHIKLNEIAENAGIEAGNSGSVNWTVRAYYGSNSVMSKEVNTVIIKRPEADKPVTTLFLTGSATEYGEKIQDAMEFSNASDSNSEFIVFSKLTAGLPFRFIDNRDGETIRSFSVKNKKLIEDENGATVDKSGVYKIQVDFSKKSVTLNEIRDISLYYCIRHRAISLQYEGYGIWKTRCLINFSKEAWGDETRYKFKMLEDGLNKFLEQETGMLMKESVIHNHDQQLWDGIWSYANSLKDSWAEVKVDMSTYSHSIEPVSEDFSTITTTWTHLAEKSTSDFIDGFWNPSAQHFNNSLSGTVNRYDYWPEAHAIDVIIDAYLRNGDHKYKEIIYDFHEGVKSKNGNTFKNSFYDDMAWHGLAHLRAYEATNDTRYEASARQLWGWILEGWDNQQGGIKWNDQPGSIPGVPSTGPATLIAVRRWVKYGDSEITDGLNNLEWAEKMYSWMRKERHDPATGGVYDDFTNKTGAWTYNTGTFLGSALELYDATGESRYLEDAIRTADWTLEHLSISTPSNKILSDWAEQEDHDVNLFKGIFIRYFTRLIMHPDLPTAKKEKYIEFIEYNAKSFVTYASSANNYASLLLYNYGWYFKPKNSFLRGQTSGCMLLEALALLEKEGFL